MPVSAGFQVDSVTISLSGLVAGECSDHCGHRPCAEGNPVIGPSVTVQVMVATKPADFRKGMEGFSASFNSTLEPQCRLFPITTNHSL
jgi:hypothetical protein